MGYDFQVSGWYKIKFKEKEYEWPCKGDLGRTIMIYDNDVLTKNENEDGTVMKHTGLGCFGIKIPDEDLIKQEDVARLRLN